VNTTAKLQPPEADTDPIERRIIERIVDDALAGGYSISVYDGEEFPLAESTDRESILAAMFSTDQDTLYFYRKPVGVGHAPRRCVGAVLLIHGNGWDVISDSSVNVETAELLARAEKLADDFSARQFFQNGGAS
jgi:hypothetical protein